MPSRLQKPQNKPRHSKPPHIPDFSIHQDFGTALRASPDPDSTAPPLNGAQSSRTLTPASVGAINSMKTSRDGKLTPSYSTPSNNGTPKMVQTIRSVPSFEAVSDTSSDTPSRNSAFSSSINSNASAVSMASHQDRAPSVRLKHEWNGDVTERIEPVRIEEPPPEDITPIGAPENHGQGWDSTIGKAGLGKTGRVINKLVSDNEALKRDIKIERLRAEESKQAAKLVEDKMERLISDYESRLLEANVTKTLLSRKERQVESLSAAVELERERAQSAGERERSWRDEMEKMRATTSKQVDDATTYAAMVEGRYNAISSHWKDQGDEVKRSMAKLKGEMGVLTEDRRQDDEKISTLRELCDQQDGNIKELRRQRDEIEVQFGAYKAQQEEMLSGIKSSAAEREREQEKMLEETREVLAKLKWALNVKENVKVVQ